METITLNFCRNRFVLLAQMKHSSIQSNTNDKSIRLLEWNSHAIHRLWQKAPTIADKWRLPKFFFHLKLLELFYCRMSEEINRFTTRMNLDGCRKLKKNSNFHCPSDRESAFRMNFGWILHNWFSAHTHARCTVGSTVPTVAQHATSRVDTRR